MMDTFKQWIVENLEWLESYGESYPEDIAEEILTDSTAAAKYGVAMTVLPASTLYPNPVTWGVNATVNLGWALTDLFQAASHAKLLGKEDETP